MRARRFGEYKDEFVGDVRDAVVGLGRGDTLVRDARVSLIEDFTGSPAWRVTLVLPRPRGDTWDAEETLDLKDAARRATDDIADQYELATDGLTSIVLAVEQARDDEKAEDPGPEPGERLDAADEDVLRG